MMPEKPTIPSTRRRGFLAFLIIVLAFTILDRNPTWIEIGSASIVIVLLLISEFVLMPRMSLPASQWCARCDARSPAENSGCLSCGREFSQNRTLYPPDLTLLSATKRPRRVAIVVMILLAIPALCAWVFLRRSGMQQVAMTVYVFLAIYGFEFVRWVCLRRIVRQVDQHSGQVCTRCIYPIDESMDICPECGKVETAAFARRDWLTTGLWFPRLPLTPIAVATSS